MIRDGKIASYGQMQDLRPDHHMPVIDARGGHVFPAWCDSHTHLVHATSREKEFEMRLHGSTYEEIAAAGGGILNSANVLRNMDESELYDVSYQRFQQVQKMGTGAIEIKSGYGLNVESELKMLRVIQKIKKQNSIPIKATLILKSR